VLQRPGGVGRGCGRVAVDPPADERIAELLFDEDRFERGLELLLDGIEAGLRGEKSR
jgi:hypothetical protein